MPQVEIDVLVTGRLPLPERYAFRAIGNPFAVIKGVCLAYVLRHPDAGAILVDTGFHPDAGANRRKDFGSPMHLMFAGLRPEPFDRQLRERGVEPAAVERVVMTHLHVDHTSGMRLLENARFTISKREWEAAKGPGFVAHHLPAQSRVDLVDFDADGRPHAEFGSTVDLLGDGSVRLVSTPGHTKGHMSVLVQTPRGEALLAGDAAYTLRNVREQVLPLLTADAARQRRSLAELKAFMDARPGVPVIPSHDPDAYRALAG